MKHFKFDQSSCLKYIIIWVFFIYRVDSILNIKQKLLGHAEPNGPRTRNESLIYRQRTIKQDVLKTMSLQFYKNNTKSLDRSASYDGNILENSGCNKNDKFAIILHGWIQSCADEWALALIDRLSFYRGGCVICIDYSVIASSSYVRLYANFDKISDAIVSIVKNLAKYGLEPSRTYMFGFSFGGQLASAVGRSMRPQYVFQNIDTCDMAGPGFDPISVDHSKAAKHVQCFHSSRDKGTFIYSCHRNVMLGSCGLSQPSVASQLHLGSHGLCVDIYINAFDYPFYALKLPPANCYLIGPTAKIPNDYTVGYEENFNNQVIGQVFVPTSLHYPYNLSKKEVQSMSKG